MAIPISTIGIKVSYAFEETAGEGYSGLSFAKIPQVKEIPETVDEITKPQKLLYIIL